MLSNQPKLSVGVIVTNLDSALEHDYQLQSPNGKHWRLSPELYILARLLNGERTIEQIAADWGCLLGRPVTVKQTVQAIEENFEKRGLLDHSNPDQDLQARRGPLLWSMPIMTANVIDLLVPRLAIFFHPMVVTLLIFAMLCQRVHLYVIASPSIMQINGLVALPVVIILLFSSIVHELGHASAVLYFGQRCSSIGLGLYFFIPVFYADVTSSWFLSRRERIVVDIAGAYFKAILGLIIYTIYIISPHPILLMTLIGMDSSILFSLNPFLKYDGYWLLSDALGVPNLHKSAINELRAFVKHKTFSLYRGFLQCLLVIYGIGYFLFFGYFFFGFFLKIPGSLYSIYLMFKKYREVGVLPMGQVLISIVSTAFMTTIGIILVLRLLRPLGTYIHHQVQRKVIRDGT